jgi:uncharacterized protein YbjT (DUF2867 family)
VVHYLDYCFKKKHKVYALTRNTQSSAAQDLRNRGANIVKGDLDDSDSIKRVVKDVESGNAI